MKVKIKILDRSYPKNVFNAYPTEAYTTVTSIKDVPNVEDIVKVEIGPFASWDESKAFKASQPKVLAMQTVHCGGYMLWMTFNKYFEGEINKLTIRRRKKLVELLETL